MKELLKAGADPNAQDSLQHTPFMMAAWFGKIDAAREIFEEVGREGGREGGKEGGKEGGRDGGSTEFESEGALGT